MKASIQHSFFVLNFVLYLVFQQIVQLQILIKKPNRTHKLFIMITFKAFLALSIVLALASAAKIVEIDAKTSDVEDGGIVVLVLTF